MSRSLAEENWQYYLGNTFQFWNGAKPAANDPNYHKVMLELEKIYHSYNIVAETTTHYVNSLSGKPFTWDIKDNQAAKQLINDWWKWQKRAAINQSLSQGKPIAESIAQMLIRDDGSGSGTGYLRLYSPQRYRNLEPYKRIVLHCPTPGTIEVEKDLDGILYKAQYNYGEGREIYTLLDDGRCLIESDKESDRILDLGGRLPIFEVKARVILGNDGKEIQNSINHALTLKDVNLKYAGFLERVVTNAQMPGNYIDDPNKPGTKIFVSQPMQWQFGANQIVNLQGMPIGDKKAPTGYTNPDIQYREPVDVTNFGQSVSIDIRNFYMSVGLGHLLSVGDGSISGVSRLTIQKDYATRLEGYSEIIENAIADIFSTVAILLLDEPAEIDPEVTLNLSYDLLPENIDVIGGMFDRGLISKRSAMSRLGIPDPESEIELILEERQQEIEAGVIVDDFVNDYAPSQKNTSEESEE